MRYEQCRSFSICTTQRSPTHCTKETGILNQICNVITYQWPGESTSMSLASFVSVWWVNSEPWRVSLGDILWMSVLPTSIVSFVGLRVSTNVVSTDESLTDSSMGWLSGMAFSIESWARWLIDMPVVSPSVSWLDPDKSYVSLRVNIRYYSALVNVDARLFWPS